VTTATICANCGDHNPPDAAFCGQCGTFLEWSEATETPAEPDPAPVASVDHGVGGADAGVSRRTLHDEPGEEGLRRPGEEIRRRRAAAPQAATRPVQPGDLICPACSNGNEPARRFCRACGAALRAGPAPPPRERWWRRLLRRRQYAAGERRRTRRRVRIPMRGPIVLAILAALGIYAAGPARPQITKAQVALQDRFGTHAPITPKTWKASSSRPGAGPERLSDRAANQFWAPNSAPAGAWVEADLPRAVRLLDVVVTGGRSSDAQQFQAQGRPYEVDVTLSTQDGRSITARVVMQDKAGEQKFSVKADRVVKVRLTFRSAHGMAPGRYLAVAEVEFFAR